MVVQTKIPSQSIVAPLAKELRAFASALRRRLRSQADAGDLTPSQTAVLHRLEDFGSATTSGLARAEGMRPQSMAAIIAALEAAGLVAAAPDPTDRRQSLLSLTTQCKKWLEHGRAARQDWLSQTIATRLTREEQVQLRAAMSLLQRLIDNG